MKMAPVRRNKDGLLARVNFPLYTVQLLTSRHILVGGGGGSSKTGVANGFVSSIFSFVCLPYTIPLTVNNLPSRLSMIERT